MRLILLGPPGAGKGTQAKMIMDRYDIPQVSTGDLFRATQQEDSPIGEQLRKTLGSGQLVDDDLVNAMAAKRLSAADCQKGFLLDGYPRTIPQAQALDRFLTEHSLTLDHVVSICIDDEKLVDRVTGRRQDPETGRIYHLRHDPPPAQIVTRLVQRDDDTEAVLRKRLSEYHKKQPSWYHTTPKKNSSAKSTAKAPSPK